MALSHAIPDDVIDLVQAEAGTPGSPSVSLLRTEHLQLLRLVLRAGHHMPAHQVAGELTIQCLQGRALIGTPRGPRELSAGQLVVLSGGEPHDVQALEDVQLLITLLR